MRIISVFFLFFLSAISMFGCPLNCDTITHNDVLSEREDSIACHAQCPANTCLQPADTVPVLTTSENVSTKRPFHKKIIDGVVSILKEFNNVDTMYIEPQHYNFTTTFMSTYSFENYRITSKSGQEVVFAPEAKIKMGPYIGWSLLFLGYTIDLAYVSANKKKELDLSIYSSMIGVDFFRRSSGHDYYIQSWKLGDVEVEPEVNSMPFNGLKVTITGLNAYYIFNHRKFSYPAAFSQSTCQRKSRGSFIMGAGYTKHTLDLDYTKLQDTFDEFYPDLSEKVDSGLYFNKIRYTDISLSAGYGYNWVFSRNWLLSVCLSAAIGYKHATGDTFQDALDIFPNFDFSFSNLNFDGVGRMGVIWNNSKWYFGAYGVLHSYTYKKTQFQTNNYFGNINVYIGFNFGRKKGHKKPTDDF